MSRYLIVLIILLKLAPDAFSKDIEIKRNISYADPATGSANLLDIYYPEDQRAGRAVLVFIHGGSWNSGKKETYWWLGRNMARKNVVTVIINYNLSPEHLYEQMARDCAAALKWVSDSIGGYGGNRDRIFVMGHSAGGHLAALINSDPRFFAEQNIENPIDALILNDAFGMDMHEYLQVAEDNDQTDSFLITFSRDSVVWKTGSPLNYLHNVNNPTLILVGERTYPAIKIQSARLLKELSLAGQQVELRTIDRKRHVGMISQMIFPGNQLYNIILSFMKNTLVKINH